jgi:hypothetical protein
MDGKTDIEYCPPAIAESSLEIRKISPNYISNSLIIDACDVTLSVHPHRESLKNMPAHGGNRTYDLWNTNLSTLHQHRKIINNS